MAAAAWVKLGDHVLQRRLRAQQQRRVRMDRAVLLVDAELEHGTPVADLLTGDLPHLDARDRHRVALAREHAGGVRELRVDVEVLLADARGPGRPVHALMSEDVAADENATGDHHAEPDRVGELLANAAHQPPPPPSTALSS